MSEETRKNEKVHTDEETPVKSASPVDGGTAEKRGEGRAEKKKKKRRKKEKKKKRVSFSTILLVLILLIGIGVLSYPTVSDWWNSMHATRAIAGYVSEVESMSKEEKEAIIEEARKFNESLANGVNFNISEERYAEYASILDITGTGVMGYMQIASIGVDLPVYHGTDESVLQIAVGHIAGSSFPVGGERTHAVLSGHRGLPSAKLFSDLDKLSEGDTFTVTVLDQTNTYQIDQIRIVLPEETDELAIVDKKDYTTLVTCTPYGVNSHRMLVRAHRIEGLESVATPSEAVRIPTYIVIPAVGIPLLFIVLVIMLIYYRRKGPTRTTQELLEQIKSNSSTEGNSEEGNTEVANVSGEGDSGEGNSSEEDNSDEISASSENGHSEENSNSEEGSSEEGSISEEGDSEGSNPDSADGAEESTQKDDKSE